jgi:NADH:ubiquinone oxidoreductase subunit E
MVTGWLLEWMECVGLVCWLTGAETVWSVLRERERKVDPSCVTFKIIPFHN